MVPSATATLRVYARGQPNQCVVMWEAHLNVRYALHG